MKLKCFLNNCFTRDVQTKIKKDIAVQKMCTRIIKKKSIIFNIGELTLRGFITHVLAIDMCADNVTGSLKSDFVLEFRLETKTKIISCQLMCTCIHLSTCTYKERERKGERGGGKGRALSVLRRGKRVRKKDEGSTDTSRKRIIIKAQRGSLNIRNICVHVVDDG